MNTDYQFYLTKAQRSLEASIALRERGDHDFAASRAYYAMFYAAEALLWSLSQTYKSHSQTIGAYGREFAKTAKLDPKFHGWLIDAEEWRRLGDYNTRVVVTPGKSEELCGCAGEFIEAAEKYLNEGNP